MSSFETKGDREGVEETGGETVSHTVLFFSQTMYDFFLIYEPGHGFSCKIACAPSEDSDQSAHLRSLIRVFVVHSMDSNGLTIFIRPSKTLIRLRRCAG